MVSPFTYHTTFHLDGPRDLLEKLRRDIERLRAAESASRADLSYVGFDCAVTAWSMVEWITRGMSPEVSLCLGLNAEYTKKKNEIVAQTLIRRIPGLAICYQLATRAKHSTVSSHSRDDVGVSSFTVRSRHIEPDTGKTNTSFSHSLYVYDGTKNIEADEFFAGVHSGLERFLDAEGIDVRRLGNRPEIDWTLYDK